MAPAQRPAALSPDFCLCNGHFHPRPTAGKRNPTSTTPGRRTASGPCSALEMTSSSGDGRVTFRVRPTEAQQRPVTLRVQGCIPATCASPTPAPGVLRGTPAPVLRQGGGTAHHPRADIWQPREAWHLKRIISKYQLSLPGVTVRAGPQLPPTEAPAAPQPLGFWPLLLLPPWGPP